MLELWARFIIKGAVRANSPFAISPMYFFFRLLRMLYNRTITKRPVQYTIQKKCLVILDISKKNLKTLNLRKKFIFYFFLVGISELKSFKNSNKKDR